MKVILFGNRGSKPLGASPESPFMRYGGDTTSVGVICGDRLIALDTGSGVHKWGYTLDKIMKRSGPHRFDVFYSHYHSDHTAGLPLMAPLFGKGNQFCFHGPVSEGKTVQQIFEEMAQEPYNPSLVRAYQATVAFNAVGGGEYRALDLGRGIQVDYMAVPHGGIQSYAYKVRQGDQCFTMISDTHHAVDAQGNPILDAKIVEFIRGSKVLIYDCHFTDADYAANAKMCQIFGHSTGEHGVRLAQAAGVPMLVKHHHNPMKTDEDLDQQMTELRDYARGKGVYVIAARPSLCLELRLSPYNLNVSAEAQEASLSRYGVIARPDAPSV